MADSVSRPPEIRALMGARALPPLVLVLFHFCEQSGYFGLRILDAPISKGYLWVEFFFALSGFILIYVYGRRAAKLWRPWGYLSFLATRLARLYPLHIATIVILALILWLSRAVCGPFGLISIFDQPYHPVLTGGTLIGNLFLVQAWNLYPSLSWNAPAWFVSIEFLLCILFPLFATLARGNARRGVLIAAAGIAGLGALLTFSRHGLDLTFHNGIYRGIADFAVGVGFAVIFRNLRYTKTPMATGLIWFGQIALLAVLFFGIYQGGLPRTQKDLLIAVPIMALVLLLAFDRGPLARLMQTRTLMALGEWSYAIYLVQYPLLQLLRTIRQFYPHQMLPLGEWGWAVHRVEAIVLLAACIAAGAALTWLVEQPANAWLRRQIATAFPRTA
jgi:peptidoglycan/LPS O-acetylase OafA/YrhL